MIYNCNNRLCFSFFFYYFYSTNSSSTSSQNLDLTTASSSGAGAPDGGAGVDPSRNNNRINVNTNLVQVLELIRLLTRILSLLTRVLNVFDGSSRSHNPQDLNTVIALLLIIGRMARDVSPLIWFRSLPIQEYIIRVSGTAYNVESTWSFFRGRVIRVATDLDNNFNKYRDSRHRVLDYSYLETG